MSKINVGQTIAVLANVGVLISIIFLSLEIRQNNEQLAAQSRFNYYGNRISEYWSGAINEDVTELVFRLGNGESLTPFEQLRVRNRLMALITGWEYEFGEMELGRITEAEFNVAAKREVYATLRTALAPLWAQYGPLAPQAFADFMNENIVNP